jgi:superfamily II DNA or RNA helicase
MLRSLKLKAVYRSDEDNILEDFYLPALSVAVSYQRAVGFFSATMLSYAAQGLSAFVGNKGKMQLIIGGELQPDDERAIRQGYDIRSVSERLGLLIVDTIESIADALCYRRLEALSWLVASGRLDIKIALRRRGMYHEKVGIIRDAEGDAVIFQGSANETAQALLPDFNFESINVFPSWREEFSPHFTPYVRGFERLWANQARDTVVLDFPEAAARKLIKIAEKGRIPKPEMEIALLREESKVPDDNQGGSLTPMIPRMLGGSEFAILPHQLAALNAWKAHDLHGILAHATGSGKTITAIYGAIRLFEAARRLALIVSVPYQNLGDQWVAVLAQFNVTAVRCYGGRDTWYQQLVEQASLFRAGAMPFLAAVVVNRTLLTEAFQQQLREIPGDSLMWVGDECHHHSTPSILPALPQHSRMRLGLSATPESTVNPNANARLKSFYGDVVSSFTLADALQAGVITPYDYHVSVVSLTDEEAEAFLALSEQISVLSAQRGGIDLEDPDDDQIKALLMKRARILGSASEKIAALQGMLNGQSPHPLTLFYCGDGSTEDDDGSDPVRDIERVSSLLYDLGWKCAHFTARESREDREALLNAFRVTAIDALVAIRCLDEGIDVPACRTAYLLASSRNPKQFIQRRGRILRKSVGKTSATIYDFLVRLPASPMQNSPVERRLLATELERVAEFAKLARNSADAVRTLMPLLREYDLAHVLA